MSKFKLNPLLKNVNLQSVCDLAKKLVKESQGSRGNVSTLAFELSYTLDILRLNYNLMEKKTMNQEEPKNFSFPITDPNTIRELDSLTPEQMEKLNKLLEEGMKELREKP